MIKGLCIDIAGVLLDGAHAIPGSVEAFRQIRRLNIPLRLVTNTSRKPMRSVLAQLQHAGITVSPNEVLTAPLAVARLLKREQLTPYLLVHPDILEEFDVPVCVPETVDAVVICDAGREFHYQSLDRAFHYLMQGSRFLAIGMNRHFREGERWHLDAGPFIQALAYATGREPEIIGKPGPILFQEAAQDMQLDTGNVLMIGDDAEADVNGAMATGMQGALVRTGKYRADDEKTLAAEARLFDDLKDLVHQLWAPSQ